MEKKKVSMEFATVFTNAERVGNYTENQKIMSRLLVSLVVSGEISEHLACFILGVVNGEHDMSVKDYLNKVRENIKKEVK